MRTANVVDLGKRPYFIRYVWIYEVEIDEGHNTVNSGTTHQGLQKAHKARPGGVLKVVDLREDRVEEVKESFENFLSMWRTNYFNPNWYYKGG